MPDPFDALRSTPDPVAPGTEFSTRLRARLERALGLPEGVIVSDTVLDTTDLDTTDRAPTGAGETVKQGDVVYASLWVGDVGRAADFYTAALDWDYEPDEYPQGRTVVGATPHHGLWEEPDPAKHTLMVVYAVDDIVAAVERVRAAGGTADDPSDQPFGVVASCIDDQGLPFAVWHALPGDPPAPRPPMNGLRAGDLCYLTLYVRDSERAREFYGSVLGWQFSPGRIDDGWQISGSAPMGGLAGSNERSVAVPMYRIDDIEAAVGRIRAAGGTATEPSHETYGWQSLCADDQGTAFYLGQLEEAAES